MRVSWVFGAIALAGATGCGAGGGASRDTPPPERPSGAVGLVTNCGANPDDLRAAGLAVRTSYDDVPVRDGTGYVNAAPRAWVHVANVTSAPRTVRLRTFGECVLGAPAGGLRSWCQEHPVEDEPRTIAPGAETDFRVDADMRFVRLDVEVVVVSLLLEVDGHERCVDVGAWVATAQPG